MKKRIIYAYLGDELVQYEYQSQAGDSDLSVAFHNLDPAFL